MRSNGRGGRVESHLPGRIRVRLPKDLRQDSVVSDVQAMLQGIDGIRDVSTNAATGSLLVTYDPETVDGNKLLAIGQAANIISEIDQPDGSAPVEVSWSDTSVTAQRIVKGFYVLNSSVSRMTRGLIDAKTGVSLLLLGMSLGRAFLAEKRAPTPWYTLLWYSYSTFMQWNHPSKGGPPSAG